MNATPQSAAGDVPDNGPDIDAVYTLEIIADLAGVSTEAVLHYREIALIAPVAQDSSEGLLFDIESLRQLRRIEHLRLTHEVNEAALKLILGLLDEVESLRMELRHLRR